MFTSSNPERKQVLTFGLPQFSAIQIKKKICGTSSTRSDNKRKHAKAGSAQK